MSRTARVKAPPVRCAWAAVSPEDTRYHDEEWGVPSRDDKHLFEKLLLEGAQAGLSWTTILHKRPAYRRAYRGFDPQQVARFNTRSVERLMGDAGIVRNRLKVESSITNARAFLDVQDEFGSFADYLWGFVDGSVVRNRWRRPRDVPTETPVSQAMSKDLKRRGFRFVGPTICYAYMQSMGLVDDHTVDCFRHGRCGS